MNHVRGMFYDLKRMRDPEDARAVYAKILQANKDLTKKWFCGHPRTVFNVYREPNKRNARGYIERCLACRREARSRYDETEEGKARHFRYNCSENELARRVRYAKKKYAEKIAECGADDYAFLKARPGTLREAVSLAAQDTALELRGVPIARKRLKSDPHRLREPLGLTDREKEALKEAAPEMNEAELVVLREQAWL